jgi:alpha-1,6-mannosyltransferase
LRVRGGVATMRTVDVSSFFSDACGGIKSYYRAKALHLPRRGVDCHFVVPGARRQEQPLGGGVLHRIPGPPFPGDGRYRMFGHLPELLRLLRRLAPDVVEIGSHLLLPALVRRALGKAMAGAAAPVVVGFFHSDVPRTLIEPLARRLPRALGRRAMSAAWRLVRSRHGRYHATFVASRAVEQLLADQGVPRVVWVGLGVDTDVFCPAAAGTAPATTTTTTTTAARLPERWANAPTLVYAGRLAGDKGFPLLLDAYDRIDADRPARLRIIGDGPARAQAERFAAARPGVSVEGYLDAPADVAAALAAADLAVTPGARETFSLATAEALACGTPAVAADEGAAGELLAASGAGLAFRAGAAGALAEAVAALLRRSPAERRAMGERGRAHVSATLTWSAVMGRIHDRYRSLLDARSGGAGAAPA